MSRSAVMLVVVAAGTTGCMAGMVGHAASAPAMAPQQETMPSGGMGTMSAQDCPMSLPGTHVLAEDTPDGEALTFTTSPDRAADLRQRVHGLADLHNRRPEGGGMMGGMQEGMHHGAMMGAGGSMAMPPPSRAVVQDIDGGARILVSPTDPADLERLRSAVRMHAQRMRETGTCAMGDAGHR